MFDYLRKSLSLRILILLFISVATVMGFVIYLTVSHDTESMLKEMTDNSEEITSAIYAGIKYPMSVGDSDAVEQQLLDIREKMKNIQIFICDTEQKIVFSTNEGTIKSDIKRYLNNEEVLNTLTASLQTGTNNESIFEEKTSFNKYLVHIRVVPNEEKCFKCHGSEKEVLGAIVLKKSTDRNYAAITHTRNNNILTSFLGICAIIGLLHTLLSRLVSRPVRSLAREIRRLPEKIAEKDNIVSPVIKRNDEIGDLQNSFYDMAIELDEKSRAIEKSQQKLLAANKELEAFAYSVSHDLRAPLRNIDGFSKILLDEFSGNLDDRAKHYLVRVRDGTTKMSVLIDDMLTFSRIGRTELQFKITNCKNIISPILEYFSAEIDSRKISVVIEDIPMINCDAVLMQSLFTNLISNAIKFIRATEHPSIVIGFDKAKKAIYVKDNGIGFDMQYHDKIFQVFQRLHLPEEYPGTGIGLAIVKRIVDRHKGTVWAESEINHGAAFFIKLPGL